MSRAPIAAFALIAACSGGESGTYLAESSAGRREMLEHALWRPDLPYSRKLLDNYGLDDRGWDLLPVLDDPGLTTPVNDEKWLELGRRTFFELPMRSDDYIEWIAARPELYETVGIEVRADGTARGLIAFTDSIGRTRTAISCAFCHARGDEPGFADRKIDLGLARALFEESTTADHRSDPRFRGWGPGRIDVTEDGVDGPTSIPDLWGVREAAYLNASGVLLNVPGAIDTLAVRFETQYIQGHDFERRPDRRRTYALALFVNILVPAANGPNAAFERSCARCHDPARGYSGDLVDASQLISDPVVARTPERGTGNYKVPSLLGIARGAPYMHDGSMDTLDEVLASGHPSGIPPPADDVEALRSFLETL